MDTPSSAAGIRDIEAVRRHIDDIDRRILDLLNERAACSLEEGGVMTRAGAPVFRPDREEHLLRALAAANRGILPTGHVMHIYREILASARTLQGPSRVAFLGPEGTFSHMACLEYFGTGIRAEAREHFQDIFEAVEQHACDLGIIPLENSVNGSVGQCLDLLTRYGVFVQAEWFSRIRQSLMSRERRLEAVRTVYSHAQALGQCAAWLKAHLPQARQVPLESTALAVHRAAREEECAAIGHAGMADSLNMHVLAGGIEDLPDNWTRFFVIGPEPLTGGPEADKSSLLFTVANRPGSLAGVLQTLAAAGINMSKLESRPMRGELWQYVFFTDLDCDIGRPEYAAALAAVREHCLSLRILGAYPAGRHI